MTYAASGVIQVLDYNGFVNTNTPNVNNIWATGSGNSGYGQPTLAARNSGNIIQAVDWAALFNAVTKSAAHQGTSITGFINGNPTSGNIIRIEPSLAGNINLINTNKLNAAAHGSTSFTTATSSTTWGNSLAITFTVVFSNNNSARYYFNAGGQFGFTFSHPAGSTINNVVNQLCSNAGTIWFSSTNSGSIILNGTSYTGVTKIGGSNPGATTVYSNNGFYSVFSGGSNNLLMQYNSGGGYYPYYYHPPYYPYYGNDSYLRISASYNGAGVLTFTCLFDELPSGVPVSIGTTATLTSRPPSTSQLANSWGTPSISYTIVAT